MTNKQLDNRIKKLQGIEALVKELKAQAEAIRAELKADLEIKGKDEHKNRSVRRPDGFLPFIVPCSAVNVGLT